MIIQLLISKLRQSAKSAVVFCLEVNNENFVVFVVLLIFVEI